MLKIGLFSLKDGVGCTSMAIHIANYLAGDPSLSVAVIEPKKKSVLADDLESAYATAKADFENDGTFVMNSVRYYPSVRKGPWDEDVRLEATEHRDPNESVQIYDFGKVNYLHEFEEDFDKIYLCTNADNIDDEIAFINEQHLTNDVLNVLIFGGSKEDLSKYREHELRGIIVENKKEERISEALVYSMQSFLYLKGITPPEYHKDWTYAPVEFGYVPAPKEEPKKGLFGFGKKKEKPKKQVKVETPIEEPVEDEVDDTPSGIGVHVKKEIHEAHELKAINFEDVPEPDWDDDGESFDVEPEIPEEIEEEPEVVAPVKKEKPTKEKPVKEKKPSFFEKRAAAKDAKKAAKAEKEEAKRAAAEEKKQRELEAREARIKADAEKKAKAAEARALKEQQKKDEEERKRIKQEAEAEKKALEERIAALTAEVEQKDQSRLEAEAEAKRLSDLATEKESKLLEVEQKIVNVKQHAEREKERLEEKLRNEFESEKEELVQELENLSNNNANEKIAEVEAEKKALEDQIASLNDAVAKKDEEAAKKIKEAEEREQQTKAQLEKQIEHEKATILAEANAKVESLKTKLEQEATKNEIESVKRDAQSQVISATSEAEKWKYAAYHDEMTGLKNKKAFNDDIQNFDINAPGALIFIDVNDLKKTNDSLGHDAGNKLLNKIAGELSFAFGDDAYRVGGDEFIVLTSMITKEIEKRMSHLIKTLDKESKRDKDGISYSFAYGIAYCDGEKDVFALKSEADSLMYEHKSSMKPAEVEEVPAAVVEETKRRTYSANVQNTRELLDKLMSETINNQRDVCNIFIVTKDKRLIVFSDVHVFFEKLDLLKRELRDMEKIHYIIVTHYKSPELIITEDDHLDDVFSILQPLDEDLRIGGVDEDDIRKHRELILFEEVLLS